MRRTVGWTRLFTVRGKRLSRLPYDGRVPGRRHGNPAKGGIGGDPSAVNELVPLVYDRMRALAARHLEHESPGHTLQPTALVNEAYLKLVDQSRVKWQDRTHFLAVASNVMRRILVDHARSKKRRKRAGGRQRIELDEACRVSPRRDIDLLELDDALGKLASRDARQASIVELRFFGGLTMDEIAEQLGVSKRTVEAEWTMIRAWLRRELASEGDS